MIDGFKIGNKDEFSEEELNVFKKIVMYAKQVKESSFDGLMEKNPLLLLYKEKGLIIGVGALKIPNEDYKNRVFKDSKTDCKPQDFTHELGWIVSINKREGIGRKMTEELANYMARLYATVRENNKAMRHILEEVGFTITGKSYSNVVDNVRHEICLYVKID